MLKYRVKGRVSFDQLCHSDKLKWGKTGYGEIPQVLIFETDRKEAAEAEMLNAIIDGYTNVHIEEPGSMNV